MRYDVIIIGAGPGGIFSAYELTKQAPDLKVAVFEAGHELRRRRCPIDGTKIKSCVGCDSCSIMSGFGGAGAFSDGKYNITNDFGGSLYEYIGKNEAIDLMKYVDDINMEYGGEGTKLYSTAGTRFKTVCLQNRLHTEVITAGKNEDALAYELEDMEQAIAGDDSKMHLEYTKDVMDMMTEFRKSWGYTYPEEE